MIWVLIGYMWLFLHRPWEIWPALTTIRLERTYMILAIVCWLLSRLSLPSRNRLHPWFLLFVVVTLVSWLVSPYQAAGDGTVDKCLKYGVFYVLLVTSVRNEREVRIMVAGYLAVMTLLMAHSLREYFLGRTVFRQGFGRLIPVGRNFDFNDLAGLIVCALPLAWPLWRHWSALWRRGLLLAYLGLSCYCIVLTGSRMGFAGLLLAGALACVASQKRWLLIAVVPLLAAGAWAVLPEKQKDRYRTVFDPDYVATYATPIGTYRYASFEKGLELLKERPLVGFGPMAVRAMQGHMPHNLYGQVLAELGLAGTVAFGLILLGVAQNTWEARRIVRDMGAAGHSFAWNTVAAAAAAILLLAIMGWGFNFLFWHVWLWFGGFQVVALAVLRQHAAADQRDDPDLGVALSAA